MERKRALVIFGVVLAAAVAFHFGLAQYLPVVCPLRHFTGIPCASCGLTRAASSLCHGRLAEATAYNYCGDTLGGAGRDLAEFDGMGSPNPSRHNQTPLGALFSFIDFIFGRFDAGGMGS